MCRRHGNIEQFRQAKQIVKDHGMFIAEKNRKFYIFRAVPGHNVYLGHCSSTAELFNRVNRLSATKETQPCNA